mgnify:CR=1 FL=1|tara:strand:- start:3621 stop:3992 length:372 start_codon:yes stop_codon:yes gene_type:complete
MDNKRIDITYLETDIPQQIIRRGFGEGAGRPRITTPQISDPNQLQGVLQKKLKDFSYLEKKAYNRLASRNTYIREKVEFQEGTNKNKYLKGLGKKIKELTKNEKKEYNRLAKIESRMKKKYNN